jgi:hypothetical protein
LRGGARAAMTPPMPALAIIGGLLALGGLVALGWVALEARRLARAEISAEAARAGFRRLTALNAGAVAAAFLGLAAMTIGLLL